MTVVAVNMPEELIARIDRAVAEMGYRSRSEFIREAVEEKLGGEERGSVRVIVVLSDHGLAPRVDQRILAAAYTAGEDLLGLYHVVLGGSRCLTTILVREGPSATTVARGVRRAKGVLRVWTMTA